MTLHRIAAAAIFAAGLATAAHADTVTLDFSGLDGTRNERPGDYYVGGMGALGSGPGVNYGVTFGSEAFVACNLGFACDDPAGLHGPQNVLRFLDFRTAARLGGGVPATINVSNGFTGDLDFLYSNVVDGSIKVWSGLNGDGVVLTSMNLGGTGTCSDTAGCSFRDASLSFDGVGRSIEFVNFDIHLAGIDDLTLHVVPSTDGVDGGDAVPEPASWALMITGFGGVGAILRRRRSLAALAV